jgi:isoamylase
MRERIKRNLLATLAFSQGVPMISHGDELGRTQFGNNNAYCHDGPLTWIDWNLEPLERELLEFTRRLFAIRAANPVLRRRTFFTHQPAGPEHARDLTWLRAEGGEMTAAEWDDPANHLLGMLIRGEASDETDRRGRRLNGHPILLLLNGGGRTKSFRLPETGRPGVWTEVIDTAPRPTRPVQEDSMSLVPHSLMLLRYETTPPAALR